VNECHAPFAEWAAVNINRFSEVTLVNVKVSWFPPAGDGATVAFGGKPTKEI
jgi:hypothetical protein